MKTCIFRAIALSALVASAGMYGCQQTQSETNAPGALPGRSAGQTPRLNATTMFAHAHLLERQGEFARAAVQYRRALEVVPDFIAARNRLGITLNKLGRHSEATQEFLVILDANPSLAFVRNNLGFSYYLEGNYAAAEAEFTRALDLKPDFVRARMNRGVAQAKLGRWSEALADFQAGCGEADAYFNLGMVQSEAGLYADAARSLELALRVNPKLEVARLQLHEVARLSAQQEAEQAARETHMATIEMHGDGEIAMSTEDGETHDAVATDNGITHGQAHETTADTTSTAMTDTSTHMTTHDGLTTEAHQAQTGGDTTTDDDTTDDAMSRETMTHDGMTGDRQTGEMDERHVGANDSGGTTHDHGAAGDAGRTGDMDNHGNTGALFLPTDFFPSGNLGEQGTMTSDSSGRVLGATAEAWTPEGAGFEGYPTDMDHGTAYWEDFGVTSDGLTEPQTRHLSALMKRFADSLMDCPDQSNQRWMDVQNFLSHTAQQNAASTGGSSTMPSPEARH